MNKMIRRACATALCALILGLPSVNVQAQKIETTGEFDRLFRVSEETRHTISFDIDTGEVWLNEIVVRSYDCNCPGTNCMDIRVTA